MTPSPPGMQGTVVTTGTAQVEWWRRGAIYQIYPRSYCDSNGDGVGDLNGIRQHLDHVAQLGVEAIWLSPIFPSPMADFGYDVSDYCGVDPVFGGLRDFDLLVEEAHACGLRVVLDWVANHTSEQHPWFQASRSSRDDDKRSWYVWADPAPSGGPPNDWTSAFRAVGSAWTFDDRTGQYYLHSFAPQQPDLNWDNPEVEAAMHDTVRFWLDRGVDGLRLDAIIKVAKDPQLGNTIGEPLPRHEDWEGIHDRLARLRDVVDEYGDRMMVGELWTQDLSRFVTFLAGDGMHLAHNFEFVDLPFDSAAYREFIDRFASLTESVASAWPCWFLENHDLPRVASRFDDGGVGSARARAVLLMLFTLRGTPFVYQGQELGLPDAVVPPDRVVDVDGRDPQRAPIPWRRPSESGAGAGFSSGRPWLPIVDDAEARCVDSQEDDPASTLHLARRLGRLRREIRALQTGSQRTVDAGPGVLAYLRQLEHESYLIMMNFGTGAVTPCVDSELAHDAVVVCSSATSAATGATVTLREIALDPGEAVLLRLLLTAPG